MGRNRFNPKSREREDVGVTPPLENLAKSLSDVDNLIENYHPKSAEPSPGRPPGDQGPLLRACVALTYAAWEVYVEDGLIWGVGEVVASSVPEQLPPALRRFVSDKVAKDPWRLAGGGWRDAVVDAVTTEVRGDGEKSFGLNTAGPGNVIKLQENVLGTNLLGKCSWPGKPTGKIKDDLDLLIRVRGAIVHTGQTPGALDLGGVRSWRSFVQRLGETVDRHLEDWVGERVALTDLDLEPCVSQDANDQHLTR